MNTLVKAPEKQKQSPPSALQIMAARFNVDPAKLHETLKQSIFPKATDAEMLSLVVVANTYNLNIFLKEMYGFPAKGGGIVPVVSVDGWNSLLLRQPDFDGIEFEFTDDSEGNVYSCTATVYVKNRSHAVKVTEYFSECVRPTDPWKNMPRRMLRNRTLCQASRMAFGISGIKHEEEALEIDAIVTSATSAADTSHQLPDSPPPKVVPPADGKTPQAELETLLVTAGFTYDQLAKWGEAQGVIPDASSFSNFSELPTDVCRRLLRAQAGLLKGLETAAKA
jgi:hypothetical protein